MSERWRRVRRLLILSVAFAAPLGAQQDLGDRAWNEGRYDEARAAYERVLATTPDAARANLRVGVLLSWQGKLDSALTYIGRARAADPDDLEARIIQARVLSWNKQFGEAAARYDSVLATNPENREAGLGRARVLSWSGRLPESAAAYDRLLARDPADRDALVGRAQVTAWQGRLDEAERRYQAALTQDPTNLDALVGLGYVYQWQGRPGLARRQAATALAIDSTYATARDLRRVASAATRPAPELSFAWSNDSDRNTNFWQTLGGGAYVGPSVRAFGTVGALQAEDPVRDATRVSGEAGIVWTPGAAQLTVAGGARQLSADGAASRTAATARARITGRIAPGVTAGLAYAHLPFDEIASLIARDLDLDLGEASVDARLARRLNLSVSGGGTWFTDGNSRASALAVLTQGVGGGFFVGTFGRYLAFEERAVGYFSPDRYLVGEGIGGFNLDRAPWSGRISAGAGGQQVGKGGKVQFEGHAEARFGRDWGTGNRVELFGIVTNSAASSTSGAYGYRSAGLTVRLGL